MRWPYALIGVVLAGTALASPRDLPPIIMSLPVEIDASAVDITGYDFGTTGLSTDVILESTNATGVTVDGLLIMDERIKSSGAGVATGDAGWTLKDNLANAWDLKEASNPYLVAVTADASEGLQAKVPLTTSHGVASGVNRVVGGVHTINTTASTAILGTTEVLTVFDQSCSLEANALNRVGAYLEIKAQFLATNMGASDNTVFSLRANNNTIGATNNVAPSDEGPVIAEINCVTTATGASGTLICGGVVTSGARAATPNTRAIFSGSTTTSTFTTDLTGTIAIRFANTWTAGANDADSIRQDFIMCRITG